MEMAEKGGGLTVFNTGVLNTFFFFFSQLLELLPGSGKISANIPAEEGLMLSEN